MWKLSPIPTTPYFLKLWRDGRLVREGGLRRGFEVGFEEGVSTILWYDFYQSSFHLFKKIPIRLRFSIKLYLQLCFSSFFV